MTIRSGYLAGYRWCRHHRYVNGYWLGHYEMPLQDALVRELDAGDVFYDIGASAGFFSLLGAHCVGRRGKVFAFEPVPANIDAIGEAVRINGISNLTIVGAAVSDLTGDTDFLLGENPSMGHIPRHEDQEPGRLEVRTIALDDFVKTAPFPNMIKMDIEGAEVMALRGAAEVLRGPKPPKLLIEVHSKGTAMGVRQELLRAGYRVTYLHHSLSEVPCFPHHVLAVHTSRASDLRPRKGSPQRISE